MRILEDDSLLLAPSDLVGFSECGHLTSLSLGETRELWARPFQNNPTLDLIRRKGVEFEAEQLDAYEQSGRSVVRLDRPQGNSVGDMQEAEAATLGAMRAGADVIYQATLFDGRWIGHPDFLLRVDGPSPFGAWSYEAAESKLAVHAKPGALLQLSAYSDGLARLQGYTPERMHLILGGGQTEIHRTVDYSAYYRAMKNALERRIDQDEAIPTYPEPVDHCRVCPWYGRCADQRREDDHLSRVASIRRSDTHRLTEGGIPTLTVLGHSSADARPIDLGARPFERLRNQARLQLEQYADGVVRYELVPPDPNVPDQGLALLPLPSAGDVFFDIEADPWVVGGGLEYLLGVAVSDGDGSRYTPFWGHSRAEEKAAFERLIDFIMERLAEDPSMHVYHYNDYEPIALKRLMGRHATRVDELDQLLRGGVLVDLYDVVRQGVRVSQESYSLKKVEKLYLPEREGPVTTAGYSTVAYEAFVDTGDRQQLADIEAYNRDDCVSTLLLRRWLEDRRTEAETLFGTKLARPELRSGDASVGVQQMVEETRQRVEALTRDVPVDPLERSPDQHARWLLAQLLDWHRREDKPQWWSFFNLVNKSLEELVVSPEALGDLTFVGIAGQEKRSSIYRYRYDPAQEHKIGVGKNPLDPATQKSAGMVVAVDHEAGTIDLKRGTKSSAEHPRALIPEKPLDASTQRESLRRVADHVIAHGIEGTGPYAAVRDLLLRTAPRLRGGAGETTLHHQGEDTVVAACRLVLSLDDSYLPIQGPPGSGKTFTAAQMVVELVRAGKRVGVTATAHKAITNLIDMVCMAARSSGVPIRIVQKADEEDASTEPEVTVVADNGSVDAAISDGTALVVAGTPWLIARAELEGKLDVLFVDEAGQMSLANVVAMGGAARSLVLLGDPNQLAQVTQGTHPDGAEASALEHVLAGCTTIPPERGLFLESTRRLHPSVCGFISDTFYEGLLQPHASTSGQCINGGATGGEAGLRFVSVEHTGSGNRSTEEARIVAGLVAALKGKTWTNQRGETKPLTACDILVVAPYNAQVAEIQRLTGGACRVGTVDKFQGQEGAVVIYSMATSSPEDAPRHREFLYSGNRLNVAISRARCLGILVANPALFWLPCRTPEQMRLVNAFWRFIEAAKARPQ